MLVSLWTAYVAVPESPRWLLLQNRHEEAADGEHASKQEKKMGVNEGRNEGRRDGLTGATVKHELNE